MPAVDRVSHAVCGLVESPRSLRIKFSSCIYEWSWYIFAGPYSVSLHLSWMGKSPKFGRLCQAQPLLHWIKDNHKFLLYSGLNFPMFQFSLFVVRVHCCPILHLVFIKTPMYFPPRPGLTCVLFLLLVQNLPLLHVELHGFLIGLSLVCQYPWTDALCLAGQLLLLVKHHPQGSWRCTEPVYQQTSFPTPSLGPHAVSCRYRRRDYSWLWPW